MNDKEEGFETIEVLSIGMVRLIGNKKGYGFIKLDSDGNETKEVMYFEKMKCYAGGVYKIEYNDKEGQIRGKMEWDRSFHDEERTAELSLVSQATDTTFIAEAQEKKARASKQDILNCLKPVRQAWANTNHAGRLALEVRVLNYLRNNSGLE